MSEQKPLWQQHDERIKALMAQVGMPESMSLYQAFKQFANEFAAPQSPSDGVAGVAQALPVAQDGALRHLVSAHADDLMRCIPILAPAQPAPLQTLSDTAGVDLPVEPNNKGGA